MNEHKYRKIVVEFVCYDKNIGRETYSVCLLDNKDNIVCEGYVMAQDVGSIVTDMMNRKL